ncbi:MAG: TVP38/TMEM64 family protein [Desulfobulbaceae bacterium]|uniref:TVP38/TMEM64 family protein n=1 Tax=Candidatus Desulfobia pelagia TaxID=2841692 RepID=A0A8J6NCN7_9BACT|nr:TVP38/TMEM64 family protein [Candidatus Desulfobia pelagia]
MDSTLIKRLLIVLAGILAVFLFYYFDLKQYLTLSYIKESQESLQQLYLENRLTVISAYMAIYIAVTALSLPGAVIMTLAGGGLFGFTVGTIVISFASTIGATIACAVSRYLLRDSVQGKFSDKLKAINKGIEEEGAFYLFTVRLIPVFPFFIVNLLLGLTKMPLITYFWVSQLGMIPGTMVYVNAGKELAKIDSLGGILSPGLIASFVILGLFPITVKKTMGFFRRKKTTLQSGE